MECLRYLERNLGVTIPKAVRARIATGISNTTPKCKAHAHGKVKILRRGDYRCQCVRLEAHQELQRKGQDNEKKLSAIPDRKRTTTPTKIGTITRFSLAYSAGDRKPQS